HLFALSPEQIRFHSVDGKEDTREWTAKAFQGALVGHAVQTKGGWYADMRLPLSFFPGKGEMKINFARRCFEPRNTRDFEFRPGYARGDNPDVIPDWRPASNPAKFAELVLEKK